MATIQEIKEQLRNKGRIEPSFLGGRIDAMFSEIIEEIVKDNLSKIAKKEIGELLESIKSRVKFFKGEVGDKGEKGDRGSIGPKGEPGKSKNGKDGRNGKDGKTPIKGYDYFDGKDGVDGSPDTPEQIIEKINSIPLAGDKISASRIKGLEKYIGAGKTIFRGGGMSTSKFISGEAVSGSGTSWTLANTPRLFLALYAQGQRLSTARGDYTIIDKTITTALSWSAGDIEADYYRD